MQGDDWTADDYDADLDEHTKSANTKARIAPGMRIQSEGGYVIVPVGVSQHLRAWLRGD